MADDKVEPLALSDDEWKKRLDAKQFDVLREEGTEAPFSSPLNNEKHEGTFDCAGCGLSMTQITLDRSERTRIPARAVNPCQASEFDWVTNRGTSAVRLNHADRAGVNPSGSQRRPIDHLVRVQRRR